jgi:hypothetical protein
MGGYLLVLEIAPEGGGVEHITVPFSAVSTDHETAPLLKAERDAGRQFRLRHLQGPVRLIRKYIQRVS